jgi:hypothetical protein
LKAEDLLVCVGVSLLFFIYLEAEKLLRGWTAQRASHSG